MSSTFRVVGAEAAIHLYALRFQQLIEVAAASHSSRKVVVLIDEYGKPIIEYRNDVPRAEANRDILEAFCGVLKGAVESGAPDPIFSLHRARLHNPSLGLLESLFVF